MKVTDEDRGIKEEKSQTVSSLSYPRNFNVGIISAVQLLANSEPEIVQAFEFSYE